MKKLTLVFFLLLLFGGPVRGQKAGEFSARYMAGWASYGMGDLKDLYRATHANLPFRPRITADFPAYYYYQIQILYCPVQDFKLGLSYGGTSTGGRSAYGDYSGTYYFDQRISSAEWGVLAQYQLLSWRSFSLNPGFSVTAVFSDHKIEERLEIYDYKDSFLLSSSATGAGFKPFVGLSWRFRFVELMAEAGYLIYTGSGLEEDGEKVLNSRGDEIEPGWSGCRLGLGLGININRSKKP